MKSRLNTFLFSASSRRFPLVFTLFSTLYTFNFELDDWEINISFFTAILTAFIIGVAILWLCEKTVPTKSGDGFAALLILIYIFHFEDIRGIIPEDTLMSEIFSRYKYVIPITLILMGSIILLFRKYNTNWDLPVRFVNGLLLLLFVFQFFTLFFRLHAQSKNELSSYRLSIPEIDSEKRDSLPDVYFILFDARTSSEALQMYWNFNDSLFLNALAKRKFTLLKNAKSNYITTTKSLAATLNMNYLDTLYSIHPDLVTPRINLKNINNSEVVRAFSHLGYAIHNLSPFKIDGKPSFYSRSLEKHFALRLWYKTLPGKIVSETNILTIFKTTIQPVFFKSITKAGVIENILAALFDVISTPAHEPKFVYAHFMLPHFPFIYKKDGSPFSLQESFNTKTKERYLEQLQYANTLALKICDSILHHSSGKSVIILQGDHGYRSLKEKAWQSKESDCMMNVWYVPDSYNARPYTGMSPVNNFRFVFDSLLGMHYGLLPDSSYSDNNDLKVDH